MSCFDRWSDVVRGVLLFIALLILSAATAGAQYNLVANGNFEGGFVADGNCDVVEPDADRLPASWGCFETYSGNWTPESSLILARADNGPSGLGAWSAAFQRLDQCNLSGDWTTIEQVIEQDVSSCQLLTLRMDVKLLPISAGASHNLGGSGHVAGVCDPSGWEYPVTVKIDYQDTANQQKCWQYGWYQYSVTQANRTDPGCGSIFDGLDALPSAAVSMQIPANQWVAGNFNLRNVLTNVKRIKKIRLGGSGWSYEGAVDNVQIICTNACAASPYPACASTACPSGQKCTADLAAGICECKPLACTSSYPGCGGTCPAGQVCRTSGSTCQCVPTQCSASYPTCGGYCPTPLSCVVMGTSCACEPLPCEADPYPLCAGPCPTGQTCVQGPQSQCMCAPLPCENGPYPACSGTCPAGQQCVAGATGCICEAIVCERSGFPQCGGTCPIGLTCQASPDGASNCVCLPPPCAQSQPPQCGGTCPAGQVCAPGSTGGACACREPLCNETTPPQCGGTCPPTLTCQASATGAGCACLPPLCAQTQPPQCGGTCPTGLVCAADAAGDICACREPLCNETQPPQCGGTCPTGLICAGDTTGGCACRQPFCEETAPPACGGVCPAGQECAESTTGSCQCRPVPCERSPYPICNGPCPQGQVCVPLGTSMRCVCQVPDDTDYKLDWPDYAPSGMPDFEQLHLFPYPFPPPVPPFWTVGTRACGPTAMLNSFWWFDSEMECDTHHTTGNGAEVLPNDTCSQAGLLGETPALGGSLADPEPLADWFSFVVPRGGAGQCTAIVSTAALARPGDADTLLVLYGSCSSGVPGDLIDANDNTGTGLQSEIVATLQPGRYWVLVKVGATGLVGSYTLSLGLDCYPLIDRYNGPDDHSPYNVESNIEGMWVCANTDDPNHGGQWKGTRLDDMMLCASTWLDSRHLLPYFTRQIVRTPTFAEVAREVLKSEDVILLLGFYWNGPNGLIRCGGHYVTSAGVDAQNQTITLSDPYFDNAEPAPHGSAGPGRVRGMIPHVNHANGALPAPTSHDDAVNVSHDRYAAGPPIGGGAISNWSIAGYATTGGTTTCENVGNFCSGPDYGQNPVYYPSIQSPCPAPGTPVVVAVEAMVDISPRQTPVCISLDPLVAWPDNLMVRKAPCDPPFATPVAYDLIRAKHCGLRFSQLAFQVDLGYAQCLANDAMLDRFEDLSPDYNFCFGSWFYLIRQSADANYGTALPGGEPELPSSGGCP